MRCQCKEEDVGQPSIHLINRRLLRFRFLWACNDSITVISLAEKGSISRLDPIKDLPAGLFGGFTFSIKSFLGQFLV